ncbi:hypothetical protein [Paenibacillus sp. IITD108]
MALTCWATPLDIVTITRGLSIGQRLASKKKEERIRARLLMEKRQRTPL